jgi:hypothetical protein
MTLNALSGRIFTTALALGALLFLVTGRMAPTAAAAGKAIDVQVEVQGHIEGLEAHHVEEIAESLFKSAGETVTEEDGPDVLVVHLLIAADDDGNGYTIHVVAGAYTQDVDFDSVDTIEASLHEVVEDVDENDDDGDE